MTSKYYLYWFLPIVICVVNPGCATYLIKNKRVGIQCPTERVTTYVSGIEIVPGERMRVAGKEPLVASGYRYGHRPVSKLVTPRKLNPGVILTAGSVLGAAAASNPEYVSGFVPAALLFSLIDFGMNGRTHASLIELPELSELPLNSDQSFSIYMTRNSRNLWVESIRNYYFHRAKNYQKYLDTQASKYYLSYEEESDTLSISGLVEPYLDLMNYQEERSGLFTPYDRTILLDLSINEARNFSVGFVGLHSELDLTWRIQDSFGDEIYSLDIKAKSQFFTSAIDSWKDALLDGLLQLLNDPGFLELKGSINGIREAVLEKTEPLVLSNSKSQSVQLNDWLDSQVTVIRDDRHASGCVISEDGYILSSYRFVGQESEVKVQWRDGKEIPASVVRKDPKTNTALLKVDTVGVSALPIARTPNQNVGDIVFAIGTPVSRQLSQSLTSGIISGKRTENDVLFFQTDAKISSGDSGSPLLNERGELIGIVNEKMIDSDLEGLSFAATMDDIIRRLKISFN